MNYKNEEMFRRSKVPNSKIPHGVNFINVKCTKNLYERHVLAAFSSYMYVEKQCLYEKFVRITLMKLTNGQFYEQLSEFSSRAVAIKGRATGVVAISAK
jgi:hypothetical protein